MADTLTQEEFGELLEAAEAYEDHNILALPNLDTILVDETAMADLRAAAIGTDHYPQALREFGMEERVIDAVVELSKGATEISQQQVEALTLIDATEIAPLRDVMARSESNILKKLQQFKEKLKKTELSQIHQMATTLQRLRPQTDRVTTSTTRKTTGHTR